MKTHPSFSVRSLLLVLFLCPMLTLGQELKPLLLPAPQTSGGKPLMQALKDRHSTREFSPEKLPPQVLANLLWAAFGINRPDTGKRTAPSAMNWQEIDVYVATAEGLYVYDPKGNKLDPVLAEDVRGATGMQPFVKDAPVDLVYVADWRRRGQAPRRTGTSSPPRTQASSRRMFISSAHRKGLPWSCAAALTGWRSPR